MRGTYAALCMALLAMLIFYIPSAQAQNTSISNISINKSINDTASYINSVNQSGYLIFYPNMTGAYNYLQLARNESSINPQYSYLLLSKARGSASEQQEMIDRYKKDSLYALVLSSIILVFMLYVLMKPSRGSAKRRRKAK